MGSSLGCSASGERLVSAARDGDLQEAMALLHCNPLLAKYSTFGTLNTPLHFAAAKGHHEIVHLLLEHGADVNSRNYCGQTALVQACRYGHWEVTQALLLYKADVNKADYLNRRTALHFASFNGHARCIRLLASDYVPSAPYLWSMQNQPVKGECSSSLSSSSSSSSSTFSLSSKAQLYQIALTKFVSKAADGGITPLHMAALNGHLDCVLLLLDLLASVSATTFHYGTAVDLIGAGSTALHYAACGGNIQCCQALISRGASLTVRNCNGWLPWDVARVWNRHWLEPLLAPNSQVPIPSFPTSQFLSLPLMSIFEIAREYGLETTDSSVEEHEYCAVCLEYKVTVAAEGCGHELCTKCALYLCSTNNPFSEVSGPPGCIPCPLCRHGIVSFVKLTATAHIKEPMRNCSLRLCTSYSSDTNDGNDSSGPICRAGRNRILPICSDPFRAVTCAGFRTMNLPLCSCQEIMGNKQSAAVA